MGAPDTHKTRLRLSNWRVCDAAILLAMVIWLVIPATHVFEIFAVGGACGDCGRNAVRIVGTDSNMMREWIISRSEG